MSQLPVRVTAHLAKHSYCTNWIREYGDGELAMEKLSRQVGTSVAVLRETYVHIEIDDAEWTHLERLRRVTCVARRQRPHVRIMPGA